ncbi:MAG TPA: T9SS type A sorting domain-containing protein [Chitinophagaceae bacterium]|jgi:hypothetical protein|nr:T9SS type A sorting domain-containing protein [Chitinophagaceae bacterium]
MKYIIATLLLICSFQAFTQTAYFKVNGTGIIDKIEKVSSGGFITAGFDSNYKHQYIRWDANYNALWKVKVTDSMLNPFSNFVIEANDGNFYATSSSNYNGGSLYVTKISSTGTILWQKLYKAPTNGERLFAPCISKGISGDNGFLFGTGDCTLSNCIVKCDANGTIEWQKQYYYPLAAGVITCWSILPDGNNYVVASGYNAKSILTFKIDATGNYTTYTANTYTSAPQIIPTKLVKLNANNGYGLLGQYNNTNNNKTQFVAFYNNALGMTSFNELTVGYTQFTLSDIAAINNGQDVIVNGNMYDNSKFYCAMLKLSNTGTIGWKHLSEGNTPGNKNVQFNGITALGNSTIHVGNGSNEGAIMAIIDSNGNGLCNTLPFNVTNVPKTLTVESSALTSFNSNVTSMTASYQNTNIVPLNKLVYCGSIPNAVDDQSVFENNISMYPNPANDYLEISYKGHSTQLLQVTIYTADGRLIHKQSGNYNVEIDTRNYKPGCYIIQMANGQQQLSKKLMIMH